MHNAYLSTLDARLGSSQDLDIARKGDTLGIPEALAVGGNGSMLNTNLAPILSGLRNDATLAPAWSSSTGIGGNWGENRGRTGRRRNESVDDVARRMESLSFFYEDEIGQAKWQGECLTLVDLC